MTTINDLSVALSVSSDDKIPLWQNANGVTRGLPISVLDGRYLMQDDIAELAADAKVEKFISSILPNPNNLPTFVAGTTFSLTLANQYYSIDNIQAIFDGTYQGLDGGSLIGFGLTFPDPIPVGTQMVYIRGGAARVIGAPSDGTVTDSSIAPGSMVSNRIHGALDVRDFGAKCDGVTDDTAAFQRAYTAAVAGQTIYVPPTGALISGSVTGTKRVFWLSDSASLAGASLPGIVQNNADGFIRFNQVATDSIIDQAGIEFWRHATYSGGVAGVNTTISTHTQVDSGATTFEWSALFQLVNGAAAGENVAAYAQALKQNTGPTWASVLEVRDTTGQPGTAGGGLIGVEIDVFANGIDTTANRVAVDIVFGKHDPAGTNATIGLGMRMGPFGGDSTAVRTGTGIQLLGKYDYGIDLSAAIFDTTGVAFKMAINQKFSFTANNDRTLQYATGSGLTYQVSGSSAFVVQDNGYISINAGQMVLTGLTSAGTATAALGANKPGANQAAPAAWEQVIFGGTTYYRPLWA